MVRSTGGAARRWGPMLALLVSLATGVALVGASPPAQADALVSIAIQPTCVATGGGGVQFTVVPTQTGVGFTYQWKFNNGMGWGNVTDGTNMFANTVVTGSQSATLSLSTVTPAVDGTQFKVVVTGYTLGPVGSVESDVVAAVAPSVITINTQPSSTSGPPGGNASLSVAASGGSGPLTYQWQYEWFQSAVTTWSPVSSTSTPGVATVSGLGTAHLTLTGLDGLVAYIVFRVTVTDGSSGLAVSGNAFVTIGAAAAPNITVQPAPTTRPVGGSAQFGVTAAPDASDTTGTLSYQWQGQAPGSTTWGNVVNGSQPAGPGITTSATGATTATLSISGLAVLYDKSRFRVVITSSTGGTVTSDPATLSLVRYIVSGPDNDGAGVDGSATFTVVTDKAVNSYEWQYAEPGQADASVVWHGLTDGISLSSADVGITDDSTLTSNSSTLTFTKLPAALNQTRIRVRVTDSTDPLAPTVASGEVLLSVGTAPVIASAVVREPRVVVGGIAHLDATLVTAPVSLPVTWTWQVFEPKTNSNLTALSAPFGWRNLRNGFEPSIGTVSGAKTPTLTLGNLKSVGTLPPAGGTQLSASTLRMPGSQGAPGNPVITTIANRIYRVIVANGVGADVSNGIPLAIGVLPTISTDPTAQTAVDGSASFTTTVTGDPAPTVRWQFRPNGSANWENVDNNGTTVTGATSTTLVLSGLTAVRNQYQYRVVVTNTLGETASSNAAILTVTPLALTITNPVDVIAARVTPMSPTAHATITAITGGDPVATNVIWQWRIPGPTAPWQPLSALDAGVIATPLLANPVAPLLTSVATLGLTGLTPAQNGYRFRGIASRPGGTANDTATSDSMTLTVGTAPTTSNPSDTTAFGGIAQFSVNVTGVPDPTVVWEVSPTGVGNWTTQPGGTVSNGVATLSLTGLTAAQNGYFYHAVVTNTEDSKTSNSAILTVGAAPTVTDPGNAIASNGVATFNVTVGGTPVPKAVAWQQLAPTTGAIWESAGTSQVSGNATTLSLTGLTLDKNGYRYRAMVMNSSGSATSDSASLTVGSVPTVTDPLNRTAVGGSATFTVTVTGDPTPTVVWQRRSPTGSTWATVSGGTVVAGVPTLVLNGLDSASNGYRYRAVASSPRGSATSDSALLTVGAAPTVSNPANMAATGTTASTSVIVAGDSATTVQWQVLVPGGSWTNLVGQTSAVLNLTALTSGANGNRYRAVVTNTIGSAVSDSALLTIGSAPDVSNPAAQTAANHAATFTVTATGTPTPTVKWQVLVPATAPATGARWADVTLNANAVAAFSGGSATLNLLGLSSTSAGYRYRAVASNGIDPAAVSDSALLSVPTAAPSFTTNPTAVSGAPGGSATFTVTVAGEPTPTVQWQALAPTSGAQWTNVSEGQAVGAFASGTTSNTLVLTALTTARTGYRYRAMATNGITPAATSTNAVLTVSSAG